jgi:putative N6-adenine-specific DNA methylase
MAVQVAGSADSTDFALSYAPLRIKDAVCDEFRKRGHLRPDVNRHEPDVLLNAFFHGTRCELSLDLTGAPLHRRGYRLEGAEAPLRENRAAALLRFCGYDGSGPFVDPFCGSGTIVLEAALIATGTAPGLFRDPEQFAASRVFPDALAAVRAEAERASAERKPAPEHAVRGSDVDDDALRVAAANAERAGLERVVSWDRGDAREITAPGSWIVSNPPYGERLETPESAAALVRDFATRVKHHAVGSTLGLVVPRGNLEKSVGLRPDRRLAVESGSMGLRYLCYSIQAGKFAPGQDPS